MADSGPSPSAPPPGAGPDDRTLLFDGVCNLCSGWARFVIRRDRRGLFRLAAIQSDAGSAILRWASLPEADLDTMVLVDRGRVFTRSDAFLNAVRYFPWPWPWLAAVRVLPRRLRDWLYNRIARNRYALFGRQETCMLPTPEMRDRFL